MTTPVSFSMRGMVFSPIELGTIRIGHVEFGPDGEVPVMTDHFSVTQLIRGQDGRWVEHELQERLLAQQDGAQAGQVGESRAERKLRSIPVRVQFDSPDLVIRSGLQAFDCSSRRVVCASAGDGRAFRRLEASEASGKVSEVPCVGNEKCDFANSGKATCKFFGRLHVQIEGQRQADNGFVLRTSSFNTLTNLEAQIRMYHAAFGGRLTGVPFRLDLRSRATQKSGFEVFHFVDISLDGISMAEAVGMASERARLNEAAGLDVCAMETVLRAGLQNGSLFDCPTEDALAAEFYVGATALDEKTVPGGMDAPTVVKAVQAAGVFIESFRLNRGSDAVLASEASTVAEMVPRGAEVSPSNEGGGSAVPTPAAPGAGSMAKGVADF